MRFIFFVLAFSFPMMALAQSQPCDIIVQGGGQTCGYSSYGSMRIDVRALDLNGGVVEPADVIEFTLLMYNMSSGNYGHYFRSCISPYMEDLIIVRGPFNWSMGSGGLECVAQDHSNQDRMLVGMTGWEPCENPVWMRYTLRIKPDTPLETSMWVTNQYIRTHNPYSLWLERCTTITVGRRLIPIVSE